MKVKRFVAYNILFRVVELPVLQASDLQKVYHFMGTEGINLTRGNLISAKVC